jgi:Mg-chelatase subunit ChlD
MQVICWCVVGAMMLTLVAVFSGCSSAKPSLMQSSFLPMSYSGYFEGHVGKTAILPMDNPADELWIISRSTDPRVARPDDLPPSGALMAQLGEGKVPMPLKHTDVRASVSAYISSVEVLQQFHNPYSEKIEAVYMFPLPHNAAVNEFIMTIGDRRIRGIIRERKEAEAIYAEARQQGYTAALLTEERPNIFTQSLANIEPGKQIDVTIKYFHTLEYNDGWYEFVFPMVVGPRFNPPGSTNGVGAVPVGAAGVSRQKTELQYLKPTQRSGHDISLQLNLDAGVAVEEFRCVTHDVDYGQDADNRLTVRLKPTDNIPNRDFVFRYRVAGDRIKTDFITHTDERGGFFTLMLYPPAKLGNLTRQPLELVFVLDCSGSMSGRPIRQAKAAVERALRLLQPDDSFQIINFSERSSQLGTAPLEATPRNVSRGIDYLRQLNGDGGTMMIEGLKAALDFPHDPRRLRFVCFLTDGYIGNEVEILAELQKRLGSSRVFSFGVGSAPNRYLLDSMARLGRGAVAYLGSRDDGARVMEDFFSRISHPGLTDLKIDWGGMQVSDVFPRTLPDLFVGRPVIVTGRYAGPARGDVKITGFAANEGVLIRVPMEENSESQHRGIPAIWARMKIADLSDLSLETAPERNDIIRQVALDYGLMSAFTAFVAVDSARRTEGTAAGTVPVAVPVPEGVNYDTTVQTGSND